MTLSDLVDELPDAAVRGDVRGVVVHGVRHDSRAIEPGDVFVARTGALADGTKFVADAIARGAVAVIAAEGALSGALGVPLVEVHDVPRALAFASAAAYGHPTFALDVVGITGTNGKTTTSQLVAQCIQASGARPGIVGTLGSRFEGHTKGTKHTSPEADELTRIAAEMKELGATHLVMEVSSIALAAARADAVRFRVAAFTNLTQDHIDYHHTMDAYREAKARLFVDLGPSSAAINVDDPFGRELASRLAYGLRKARYSTGRSPDAHAEIGIASLEHSPRGIRATVRTPLGRIELESSLVGAHNVENLLCAVAVGHLLDLSADDIARGLSQPTQVPGRLERCDDPSLDDVAVLVDYAHTPDALERVLASVRPMTSGRVLCVFGCGGDRDAGKRPLMGEAAVRGADFAIVTNDNPRSEDPQAIADQILRGLTGVSSDYEVDLDRERAIHRAIELANPGDVVLVAGKGHETYQIIGPRTLDFDDRVVARAALDARRSKRGGKAS